MFIFQKRIAMVHEWLKAINGSAERFSFENSKWLSSSAK